MKHHKQSEAAMLREVIAEQKTKISMIESKIAELEEKHWKECMQIAHYSSEEQLWHDAAQFPPKQYENVIVCTKSGRVTIAARHAERAYFTPALHRVEHVTHWMPLPEVSQYE